MRYRGGYWMDEEQFFVHFDGSPVTPVQVRTVLRQLLMKLTLDPLLYDTMSLRSGRVVDLYHSGWTVEELKIAVQ